TGRGRWSWRPERRRSSRLLLCPRPSCQVQRMFPNCTVKQSFTIVGGPRAEPASPVPAARTAQAGDDDGGRERSFDVAVGGVPAALAARAGDEGLPLPAGGQAGGADRKSTRLNSSHVSISYAVFCLKKKRGVSATRTRIRS